MAAEDECEGFDWPHQNAKEKTTLKTGPNDAASVLISRRSLKDVGRDELDVVLRGTREWGGREK